VVNRPVAPVQPLTASLTAAKASLTPSLTAAKAESANEILQRLVDAMLSAAVEDGAADAEDDMDEQETADRKEAA
jgi:hypothetical protein